MKLANLTVLIIVAAFFFATPMVSAQNDAPAMDALMALEKQANEASDKGDTRFFEGILSDKFVMRLGYERLDKPAFIKVIAGMSCDIKTLILDEPTLTRIDADTYVLIYRNKSTGTCTMPGDNKPVDISDGADRMATIWIRSGDKWLAAFHGSNAILDPKDAPKAAKAEKSKAKRPDATTIELVGLEKSVWQAWRLRDRKKIEALTAESVAFVDIFGNAYANRADIINAWSSNICKVRSVSVTDAVAFSLSPTVKLLTHTGTANGTCYGAKIGPIYGNSIYVRAGKAWKLAFTMNMPAL